MPSIADTTEAVERLFDDGAEQPVDATVVIPTFNRRQRLEQVLDCLDRQETRTSSGQTFRFEVVVVSDGSTDGTHEMLDQYVGSFTLRVIRQKNAGPAAARNTGIQNARGDVVMFLDDDVMPEPNCLAAHMAIHERSSALVVVGPMSTPTDIELQPWVRWEQHQLEKQYARLKRGERLYARQFYTGNASVRRLALLDAGMFDTSLHRSEDIELGRRLEEAGQSFIFSADAEAYHHADRTLSSWSRVAYDYGHNDVSFADATGDGQLADIPRFFSERNPLQRILVRKLIPGARRSSLGRRGLTVAASVTNRLGARMLNRMILSALYGMHYYQGVADALGSPQAFLDLISGSTVSTSKGPEKRFVPWMVLEQTLGHITHSKNLHSHIPDVNGVEPVFIPVPFDLEGRFAQIPLWSNWTLRSGVRARRELRSRLSDSSVPRPDALFVHSQVPAVLLGSWLARFPTVVSLDATPRQYDAFGEFYDHESGDGSVEKFKDAMNRRCYERASHLVTWSEWTKDGLVEHYGVDPAKVTVISPGVDVDMWKRPDDFDHPSPGVLRVLFVGGDLARKGGVELLEANRRLRADPTVPEFEMHLVTGSPVDSEPGVVRHAGLTANDPKLIEQYHLADIFCLPTHGDCLPMVLAEAGAAGLPLVSTDVAAIPGIVRDGETGLIVKPGDVDGLVEALRELLVNPDRRRSLGDAARSLVEQDHNAAKNAELIIQVMKNNVGSRPSSPRTTKP